MGKTQRNIEGWRRVKNGAGGGGVLQGGRLMENAAGEVRRPKNEESHRPHGASRSQQSLVSLGMKWPCHSQENDHGGNEEDSTQLEKISLRFAGSKQKKSGKRRELELHL